jgi:hypothetical protein
MKSSLFSRMITALLVVLLAGSAFAANGSHKESFQISAAAQVNGKQLPPGDYEVRWEGSGPSVQVNITQGKKVVATVPAQLVNLDRASNSTETEIRNSANGDRELTALRFSGKKYALDLGSESAKSQGKTDSANE